MNAFVRRRVSSIETAHVEMVVLMAREVGFRRELIWYREGPMSLSILHIHDIKQKARCLMIWHPGAERYDIVKQSLMTTGTVLPPGIF